MPYIAKRKCVKDAERNKKMTYAKATYIKSWAHNEVKRRTSPLNPFIKSVCWALGIEAAFCLIFFAFWCIFHLTHVS